MPPKEDFVAILDLLCLDLSSGVLPWRESLTFETSLRSQAGLTFDNRFGPKEDFATISDLYFG